MLIIWNGVAESKLILDLIQLCPILTLFKVRLKVLSVANIHGFTQYFNAGERNICKHNAILVYLKREILQWHIAVRCKIQYTPLLFIFYLQYFNVRRSGTFVTIPNKLTLNIRIELIAINSKKYFWTFTQDHALLTFTYKCSIEESIFIQASYTILCSFNFESVTG